MIFEVYMSALASTHSHALKQSGSFALVSLYQSVKL